MKKFIIINLFFYIFVIEIFSATNDLLYFEAQGIIGYSSMDKDIIYHSGHSDDAMQKNSIGIDYIKKFSTQTKDIGTLGLQMRLAYSDSQDNLQLQVYNAYFKKKIHFSDIWFGHNRIAFGLASYWDTHGELLQPLYMYGFGFDRDWGVGFSKDTQNGNIQSSLTSGSGMPLKSEGNWLFTSRISKGVLNFNNYNIGASIMYGQKLDTMGYKLMDDDLKKVSLIGFDFAYNHNNIEHKTEIDFGEKDKKDAFAGLYRLSINLLEENRLKLDGQYVYTKDEKNDNFYLGCGVSYKITSDITTRIMYEFENDMNDKKIVGQLYYYFLA
ncbi:MAG: hypothetical protein LBF97_07360 [Elusimicrobiota bacterium]|jgi:hypothetical protein|nr:hypothetical protein [Elusimicrobiota bacterium]